jgi:tRNA pseudouridine32 synthase / 23S rRNA pseudouridine746 synthase
LNVIYEDSALVAVDKPAGQNVIPGRGEDEQEPLLSQVASHIGKKAYVVHRLDKETSGLVVFAKDPDTHRQLSILWEKREVKKAYLALVQGLVERKDGTIKHPLKSFGSGRMGVAPRGKPSQTFYRVLWASEKASYLEIQPLTGRRHQIRVHLYNLGHPVLGDGLYGHDRPVGGCSRLMLHAHSLEIPLISGPLALVSKVPIDFQKILHQFQL